MEVYNSNIFTKFYAKELLRNMRAAIRRDIFNLCPFIYSLFHNYLKVKTSQVLALSYCSGRLLFKSFLWLTFSIIISVLLFAKLGRNGGNWWCDELVTNLMLPTAVACPESKWLCEWYFGPFIHFAPFRMLPNSEFVGFVYRSRGQHSHPLMLHA